MNLPEFKAWFEGFTESLTGAPNAKQWARIQEKIGKIKDEPPTTRTVFVDHWARPWRRWIDDYPHVTWGYAGTSLGNGYQGVQVGSSNVQCSANSGSHQNQMAQSIDQLPAETFDSGAAFRDLGRAEMKSMRG